MKKHKLLSLVCTLTLAVLLGGAGPALADEEAAPEQELPPEVRHVLSELDAANEELEALTARVRYERLIPLLDETQRSRGSLTFRKPHMLHLELGRPRNEEVWSDGRTWWLVSHNSRQVEIYEATAEAGPETAFLDFGYGRGSEALLEDYEVKLVSKEETQHNGEAATEYRLRFTARPPRRDEPPPRYATIEIELSSDRWLPHTLVLHESGGEILHTYRLSRIELNPELDDDRFDYRSPRGYTVLRPGEQ